MAKAEDTSMTWKDKRERGRGTGKEPDRLSDLPRIPEGRPLALSSYDADAAPRRSASWSRAPNSPAATARSTTVRREGGGTVADPQYSKGDLDVKESRRRLLGQSSDS